MTHNTVAENQPPRQMESHQMIKMVIFCVIAFALTWMPFNALILIGDVYNEIWEYPNIMYIWFITHYLAMCHTITNPLIYIWMNNRFRAGFKQVIGDIYYALYRLLAFLCCFLVCLACCLQCSRKKYGRLMTNLNRKRSGARAPLNSTGSVNIYANSNHHQGHHHYNHTATSNNCTNNSANNSNANAANSNNNGQSNQQRGHSASGVAPAAAAATTTNSSGRTTMTQPSNRSSGRNFNLANEQTPIGSLAAASIERDAQIASTSLELRARRGGERDSMGRPKAGQSSASLDNDAQKQTDRPLDHWRSANDHDCERPSRPNQSCDRNHENGADRTRRPSSAHCVAIQMDPTSQHDMTRTTAASDDSRIRKHYRAACQSSAAAMAAAEVEVEQEQRTGLDNVKPKRAKMFSLSKKEASPSMPQMRPQSGPKKRRRSKKQTHSISLQMTTSEFYRPPASQTNRIEDDQSMMVQAGACGRKKPKSKGGPNEGLLSAVRRAARELRKPTALSLSSNCPTCRGDKTAAATAPSCLSAPRMNNVSPTWESSAGKPTACGRSNNENVRSLKFVVDTAHQSSISTATNSVQTNITSLAISPLSSSRELAGAAAAAAAKASGPLDGAEVATNNSNNTSASSFSNAENGPVEGDRATDERPSNHFEKNNPDPSMATLTPASRVANEGATATRSSCNLEARGEEQRRCKQMAGDCDDMRHQRQRSLDGLSSSPCLSKCSINHAASAKQRHLAAAACGPADGARRFSLTVVTVSAGNFCPVGERDNSATPSESASGGRPQADCDDSASARNTKEVGSMEEQELARKDSYCAEHRQLLSKGESAETDEDVCDAFDNQIEYDDDDEEESGDENYDEDELYDEEAEELELDYGEEHSALVRGDGAIELIEFKTRAQQSDDKLEFACRQVQTSASALFNGADTRVGRHFRRLFSLSTGDNLHRAPDAPKGFHHYYAIKQQHTESVGDLSREGSGANMRATGGDQMAHTRPQSICNQSHFLLNLKRRSSAAALKLSDNSANNITAERDESANEAEGEEYEIMAINGGATNDVELLMGKSSLMSAANEEELLCLIGGNVDLTTVGKREAGRSLERERTGPAGGSGNNFSANNSSGGNKNNRPGELENPGDLESVDGEKTSQVTSSLALSGAKPFERCNQAHEPILATYWPPASDASGGLKQTTPEVSPGETTTICNQSSSAPNSETKRVCRQHQGGARQAQQHHQRRRHQQHAQLNGLRPGQIRLSGAYSMPAHFYQLQHQPAEASERKFEVEV